MKKKILLLITSLLISGMFVPATSGEGLPVARYMEDPEHMNEIISYYLNAFMSGITLANEKSMPRLFCVPEAVAAQGIYVLIDRRIADLQKLKKLSGDMSVDSIIMDMLVEEFPCK